MGLCIPSVFVIHPEQRVPLVTRIVPSLFPGFPFLLSTLLKWMLERWHVTWCGSPSLWALSASRHPFLPFHWQLNDRHQLFHQIKLLLSKPHPSPKIQLLCSITHDIYVIITPARIPSFWNEIFADSVLTAWQYVSSFLPVTRVILSNPAFLEPQSLL